MENNIFQNNLPDELWAIIFKCFHPVYDNLFTLSLVCKQWRRIIVKDPDPSLWESVEVANVRHCYLDSPLLNRFTSILKRFAKCIKILRVRRCHSYFSDVVMSFSRKLCSLQVLEISGMSWSKEILQELPCYKTLRSVKIEAAETMVGLNRNFRQQDLCRLVENFPRLTDISLQYSIIKGDILNQIQEMAASKDGYKITELHIERAKIEPLELNDIVQNFDGLKRFSYGNDQILGLPSIQQLMLNSSSIREMYLFQIGDFTEFCFELPQLQILAINVSTSIKKLSIYAPSLRILHLKHCTELRKLSKISSTSLHELKICKCSALSSSELIRFLVQNPDIKTLELDICVNNLRLDQNSNPSLEKLKVLDSGLGLLSLDVRCPKLKVLTFKKSLLHSSLLKFLSVRADEMEELIIRDVPHIRKVIINVSKINYFELDFDKRIHRMKPAKFTIMNFTPNIHIGKLVFKKLNIQSVVLSKCTVRLLILDSCNLDASLSDMLGMFCNIHSLTLQNCYGPCQMTIQNSFLKELLINSCSSVLMDHINVLCPSLERLCVHGSSILPSKKEVENTANALRKDCPGLLMVNFSH